MYRIIKIDEERGYKYVHVGFCEEGKLAAVFDAWLSDKEIKKRIRERGPIRSYYHKGELKRL